MTIEGAFSQLIVKTNSNPKFDMGVLREDLRCMLPLDPDHGEAYVCDYECDH